MMEAVTTALSTVLSWVGTVVTSLLAGGELASLLPLLAVGIAISAFLFGLKAIRSVMWGS